MLDGDQRVRQPGGSSKDALYLLPSPPYYHARIICYLHFSPLSSASIEKGVLIK